MALEAKIAEFLDQNFDKLRIIPNVLNIGISTKMVNGQDTGRICITFYVSKKVDSLLLKANELIPKLIGGFETDVVELKTSDYNLGDTAPIRSRYRMYTASKTTFQNCTH